MSANCPKRALHIEGSSEAHSDLEEDTYEPPEDDQLSEGAEYEDIVGLLRTKPNLSISPVKE